MQWLASCHLERSKNFYGLQVWVIKCRSVDYMKDIIHLILLLLSIVFDLFHHVGVPVIIVEHVIIVS